ncbi:MAG: SusC/RagA family TonB-linked outer membrane protein [Bacteroidetes bacterium GWF2_42_66]|nr:MAG: SusC/RagA family TonB-linked outer membrane protein [Bacteroidetes bacterium GWA2_42_15]OFX97280.1 MAG: SusC/RagA family TonB-linked outer membrane protein [Bacteroidetes bacterium GWE2_42_39]OFY39917.1 MAG: SusC/RagA family TonB-linked outer membrane protein [Bacteroidetes bacterium GWF2_42_66]HBL78098.1 SusC/RagA family TonB-linked outer membrane protein [Prolixibacteraceae bacterium]HCR90377.1 SusC/RagA family TonB-linked outer membrane protein [Prolixibacteraceae bacterium]
MEKNKLKDHCGTFPLVRKGFLIMRLFLFLMILGVLQSTASVSQTKRFSLNEKDISVKEVLNLIEKQSGYRFFYEDEKLNVDEKLSINIDNSTIEEVLVRLFKQTNIEYKVLENNFVVLKSKNSGDHFNAPQQSKTVSGKVTDSAGAPLPGVSVVIKGTTQGIITDFDGKYSLNNVPTDATLVFSFVGMKTVESAVSGKSVINITLAEETIGIEEVVAVGYGTQKKINLSGSVDVVSGEKLENRPAVSTSLLLQGAAPNVMVSLNSYGGEPGAEQNLSIRGVGSISGNDSPLTLVDGVEMENINNLDPSTIESVSILKDASASAIYGSRAAFGVILITTKRGKSGQPLNVQYTNNISFAIPIYVPSMEDSYTYAIAFNQSRANAGLSPTFPDAQVERILGYQNGTYESEYDPANPPYSNFRGRWDGNANNNWTKLYWKDYSVNQKHNINISGGDKKMNYYFSAGYFDQPGLNSWNEDSYKRYNVLANISSQVNEWFRFDFDTKFMNSQKDYPYGRSENGRQFIFSEMLDFFPTGPMYNLDGSLNNPLMVVVQEGGRSVYDDSNLLIKLGGEIEPIKGWKTYISYNYGYNTEENLRNPKPIMMTAANGKVSNVGQPLSGAIRSLSQEKYQLFTAYTSFEKTIGKHYFKALVGYEQDNNHYEYLYGKKTELITEDIVAISAAIGESTLTDSETHWATQGIFGRLNYNYEEKYLFEFSARYDGSSRFADGSRWGFFPSVSAAYNIAKENFWAEIKPYVNTLKLRGSYGSLGNQNVDNYLYLATIDVQERYTPGDSWNRGYLINGEIPLYASQPSIISNNLTWETVTTLNVGLDAEFLKNRLSLSAEWYNRVTSDMIGPAETLPSILGASSPKTNNAKLSTKGYELSIGWKDRISSNLSYNARVTLGDYKTTILEYMNVNGVISTWYEGKVVGDIWGLTTDGIIQEFGEEMPDQSYYYAKWSPGDIKYKDISGPDGVPDGKITPGTNTLDDHGDLSVIANSSTRYNFGISAGLNWKNFDVSMFWQGVGKSEMAVQRDAEQYFGLMQTANNSCIFEGGLMLDYWRPADETNILGPNTDAFFPKPYGSAERNKNLQIQSRYVLDAAYIRLKNLQIGYTIPQHILDRIFVKKARVYVSGENLLTFSKLPDLFEPETTVASNSRGNGLMGEIYPITKMLSFGVSVTF